MEPRLTYLTSLEYCRLFVSCKLENRVGMRNLFGESGLQTHPLNLSAAITDTGRRCLVQPAATFHNATTLAHPRTQFGPLYVKMQKTFANTPSQPSRFRMIACPRVAKEAVLRFRYLHVHIRFPEPLAFIKDRANLLRANMLVAPAPEKKHRRVQVHHLRQQRRRNPAALKRNR